MDDYNKLVLEDFRKKWQNEIASAQSKMPFKYLKITRKRLFSSLADQNDLHYGRQRSDLIQGPQQGSLSELVEQTLKETASHSGQGFQSKPANALAVPEEKNLTEVNKMHEICFQSIITLQYLKDTARNLYMVAVKHEQSGEVVQAIKWYKKALQLDPDIEQQIYAETRRGYTILVAV